MAAVTFHSDFGAQESKLCHCFHFFPPSICHEMMGLDAMILVFNAEFYVSFFILFHLHQEAL